VDRLNPLLHIDPVVFLPPEITFEIFSYFDPPTLLRATTLSKSWRARALDSRLWRKLFGSEGWNSNIRQVRAFEEAQRQREADQQKKGKSRARPAEAVSDAESKSPKKRAREKSLFAPDDEDTHMGTTESGTQWGEQHGAVEADEDEKMEDVTTEAVPTDGSPGFRPQSLVSPFKPTPATACSPSHPLDPPLKPSLLTSSSHQLAVSVQAEETAGRELARRAIYKFPTAASKSPIRSTR
jgi:F-box and WD-40 domain protein 1/11